MERVHFGGEDGMLLQPAMSLGSNILNSIPACSNSGTRGQPPHLPSTVPSVACDVAGSTNRFWLMETSAQKKEHVVATTNTAAPSAAAVAPLLILEVPGARDVSGSARENEDSNHSHKIIGDMKMNRESKLAPTAGSTEGSLLATLLQSAGAHHAAVRLASLLPICAAKHVLFAACKAAVGSPDRDSRL